MYVKTLGVGGSVAAECTCSTNIAVDFDTDSGGTSYLHWASNSSNYHTSYLLGFGLGNCVVGTQSDNTEAGGIRYNSGDVEVYNGSAWKGFLDFADHTGAITCTGITVSSNNITVSSGYIDASSYVRGTSVVADGPAPSVASAFCYGGTVETTLDASTVSIKDIFEGPLPMGLVRAGYIECTYNSGTVYIPYFS